MKIFRHFAPIWPIAVMLLLFGFACFVAGWERGKCKVGLKTDCDAVGGIVMSNGKCYKEVQP